MLRLVVEAIALSPVDVPRRVTRVKVQWRGGAVGELEVERPDRRDRLRTPEATVARIRALAVAGLRDEQIAETLNAEGVLTGRSKNWKPWAVKWARRRERIPRVAPDLPRRTPMPERHPDGRYSIAGAAKRLGVTVAVVRRQLAQGLLSGSREAYGPHRDVWWLDLDESVAPTAGR
jgi:hypothetical protein